MEVSAVTHPIPSHFVVLLSRHLNLCLFLFLLSSVTVIVGFVFLLLYCPSTLVDGGYRSCTSLIVDVVRIAVWRSLFFLEDAVGVRGIVAVVVFSSCCRCFSAVFIPCAVIVVVIFLVAVVLVFVVDLNVFIVSSLVWPRNVLHTYSGSLLNVFIHS